MRIRFGFGRLDGNHHGTEKSGRWNQQTRRSTWSIVPLGRELWLKKEGRRSFGRRLWLYGPSGACVNFDVFVEFAKCPLPPGHRYGPADDGGVGTVML